MRKAYAVFGRLLKQLFLRRQGGLQPASRSSSDDAPDALLQRAIRTYNAGDVIAAHAAAAEVVSFDPGNHVAWNLLGALALAADKADEATEYFGRAVALCPGNAVYLSNCGESFRRAGKVGEAIRCCRAALEADRRHAPAHHNLALALNARGDGEEALVAFRNAFAIWPDFQNARSGFLYLLSHHLCMEPSVVLAEHRRWGELHARPPDSRNTVPSSDIGPDQPLRVGYVSGDFSRHAVSYFIEPLLANHDAGSIEVYCYYNSAKVDEVTVRLRSYVQRWRVIAALSDDEVARQVSEDRIDVLIDLSGHTAGSRLLAFARKPAPVQASYLGYLNTTGLHAIDFRITDSMADPVGVADPFHTERLVRLPHSLWCYRPPNDTPSVNPLPALQRGKIMFGSLHNLAKINRKVIELWALLLKQQANAELLIGGIPDTATGGRLREQFSFAGVDGSRLHLIDRCNFDEYWRLYHRIDISLDAFPYNGATTTCESLWMGVPVVTLAGQYGAARSGVSLLTSAGLRDLIANDPGQYVHIARGLANDMPRLCELRSTLRARLQQSPLMNEIAHARAFEAMLRSMACNLVAGER